MDRNAPGTSGSTNQQAAEVKCDQRRWRIDRAETEVSRPTWLYSTPDSRDSS